MTVISSGQTMSNVVVSNGLTLDVLSGAIAFGALILSGGAEFISAGGIDDGATIESGGGQFVLSGGQAFDSVIESGAVVYGSGGATYDATQINTSGTLVVAGGIASATSLANGGQQQVIAGSAVAVVVSAGGVDEVGGGGTGGFDGQATILAGGLQSILASGLGMSASVQSGGVQSVASGGSAVWTTLASGGLEFVSSGGAGFDTSVGPDAAVVVSAAGTLDAAMIAPGGVAVILGGGVAIGTTVANGGTLIVLPGANVASASVGPGGVLASTGVVMVTPSLVTGWAQPVSGIAISSGGSIFVLAGGMADDVDLLTGASATIEPGGNMSGGTLSGFATAFVYGDATSIATVDNAVMTIGSGGMAYDAIVVSDGELDIGSGGTAEAANVSLGGFLSVEQGGFANTPVIGSSGTLLLEDGAGVGSGLVFAGADATLDILGTSMPGAAISGFAATDTIDLVDLLPSISASAAFDGETDQLTIVNGGTTLAFRMVGDFAASGFQLASDGSSGTLLTELPCFGGGTLIATDRGDVPIEMIRPGDLVLTNDGRLAPVRWVGRRSVDCRRHAHRGDVLPVRIAAHAFARCQPRRDLWLSRDHAVFLDGVLIPVRYLLNGATVAVAAVAGITYLHLELDRHDVILAEGLPAETYLDTGNRSTLGDSGNALHLYPALASGQRRTDAYAPLVVAGPQVTTAKRRLLVRATGLGFGSTDDPALTLLGNGRPLTPVVE